MQSLDAVRGRGYIKSLSDLEQIVVKNDKGVAVLLKDVARVELVPDERRGITEMNGEGEVVSGIALQRFGENALSVISERQGPPRRDCAEPAARGEYRGRLRPVGFDQSGHRHAEHAEKDFARGGSSSCLCSTISSLTAVIRDNDAECWNPIQEWLLRLRRRGVSVLIVHHAGKGGEQRGTSRREDVLDTSVALRRPSDYVPTEGARFEVHFEKARGIHGDRAKPFEAKLEIRDGAALWTIREIEDVNLSRVKALLDDELSIRDIADETGLSKSTVHRIKKQIEAEALGQPVEPVSHNIEDGNCPRPRNDLGTPRSHANQGNSAAVPLSQPLGIRDMGHLTVVDDDPFASLKDESLIPDIPAFLDRRRA